MSFASKFNKSSKFTFKAPEGVEPTFKKLSEYPVDTTFRIVAMYINRKGKYKDHPVFVTPDNVHLDIPAGNTVTVKEILSDKEAIQDINDGKVGIITEKYHSTQYGDQIGFKFIDM